MHGVHRPAGQPGGRRNEKRRHRLTKADLLALHVAKRGIDAQCGHERIALRLGPIDHGHAADQKHGHRGQKGAALPLGPDHAPEGDGQRGGQDEHRPDRKHVRQCRGVFERMGRVGVEEAAAIGPKLLDSLLAGHRPERDGLARALKCRRLHPTRQGLRHPERDEGQRNDDGQRQENVKGGPGQIDPEVAKQDGPRPRKGPRHGHRQRDAGRRRQEVMDGKPRHLAEMAHRGFARIGLPVGVGEEADRRIEGEIGGHAGQALGIEGQHRLHPQDQIERGEPQPTEHQHRKGIAKPVLLARRVDARNAIKTALDRAEDGVQKGALAREEPRHVAAKGHQRRQHQKQWRGDL